MPTKCKFENCKERAYYGYSIDKKRIFCKKHKIDDMISLKNSFCKCNKSASFNFQGLKPRFCYDCKSEGMINVANTKCYCGKRAYYNYLNESPKFCKNCKEEDMVNVCQSKCFCGKYFPSFNYPNLKPKYCNSCKLENMVNTSYNKCFCKKHQPSYNIKGEIAKYCAECKTDIMINVLKDRCKGQENNCVAWGNPKYKGYCTFCFQNEFPNDELIKDIHFKTMETKVKLFIDENFEEFIHDKVLWTGNCECVNRRRIDHRKLINNTLLCIETDEFQHKNYDQSDEEIRYNDLYMIHSGKWIFIRFNPDKYKNKDGKYVNTDLKIRLEKLKEEINKQISRIEKEENTELLEIIKLYYNEN